MWTSAANTAIFQAAPLLAAVAMFAVYTLLVGDDLTSDVAFPALAWVNVRTPDTHIRTYLDNNRMGAITSQIRVNTHLPASTHTHAHAHALAVLACVHCVDHTWYGVAM